MNEPVIFNMAAIPQRVEALRESVQSILPQCDELHIYLNEWASFPTFLDHPRIKTYISQKELDDLGDVGKFFNIPHQSGYIFTVDDKIIYPKDYAAKMIETIEKYGRKAVVSCHGRNIKPNCKSYYFDFAEFYCVYNYVATDVFVHELGTGCMAYHSDVIDVSLLMFPHINMTDIYFSIELQKRSIPILVRAHKARWIRMSRKHDDRYSIHAHCNRNDAFQTRVVNEFNWRLNKTRPLQ